MMGKRSTFERVPRDFYPTPPDAVLPLIPHLPAGLRYWEPCCGDGAIIRALPGCVAASDIAPLDPGDMPFMQEVDALTVHVAAVDMAGADYIITNPPWDRRILHLMIAHFSAMRPTWLLFDADWIHTRQAAPFMPWLRKIVSVGRVKWIPDSKMTGKDNCAWMLFDQSSESPTQFIGREP